MDPECPSMCGYGLNQMKTGDDHWDLNRNFLTLTLWLYVAACDASTSAHFVLDSRVSMHANAHNLLLWDARIALWRSQPDPNAKWHNRDIKASHLQPRRAASYQLRWGSTLVPLCWNAGHFCTSGPVNQLIWRLGSVPTLQLEETRAK